MSKITDLPKSSLHFETPAISTFRFDLSTKEEKLYADVLNGVLLDDKNSVIKEWIKKTGRGGAIFSGSFYKCDV
jgi:hypothetical protein